MYMYEIIICSIECLKYNQICNQLIKIKEKFLKLQTARYEPKRASKTVTTTKMRHSEIIMLIHKKNIYGKTFVTKIFFC